MSFFRNMDLYKGLILSCALLLLPAGWWIMKLQQGIDTCNKAIATATKANGQLEDIGQLQKKMDTVRKNSQAGGNKEPRVYFEKQILAAALNGDISSDDFTIPGTKEVGGSLNKQQQFKDEELDIQFGKSGSSRTERTFNRKFIFAVLWNCESGAGSGASVWKLRRLQMINATDEKLLASHKAPPPELEDRWQIKELKFARRGPSTRK